MSMVEVRHRASEALQKPLLHETARHEWRLWIFDPVSSRAAKRKQETNAPSLSGDGGAPAGRVHRAVPSKTVRCARQTGIHFILTSKMQTGDHGQPQRPGRLGHDGSHFGGSLLLGGRRRD
jgi:hypothetical protein